MEALKTSGVSTLARVRDSKGAFDRMQLKLKCFDKKTSVCRWSKHKLNSFELAESLRMTGANVAERERDANKSTGLPVLQHIHFFQIEN